MAAADDASSDWIYLREALELAAAAFGRSEMLAKKRLKGWLAAGKLPWDCDDADWRAPTAAEIAGMNRILAIADSDSSFTLYHKGDLRIFADDGFETDWENSAVREITYQLRQGVEADGIKVPRAHLLELLPTESREREETPEPIKPAERELMVPARWLAWARKEYPKQQNEGPSAHILRLHGLMQKADNVTEVWTFGDFRRRYYEQLK